MKKPNLKRLTPFIVALITFLAIGIMYCSPVLEGRVLQAGDTTNYLGASNEIRQYSKSEGRQMWWTNSMFGGMPSYQISGQTPANKLRVKLEKASHLWLRENNEPIGILVAYMIGFFIMLMCFDVDPWMSIAGAIALTLSSYFLLILPAGHVTKANAICCLAPMIGGFYAIFRSRFWLGVPVTLFYGTIGLTLHSQMTYYAFMLLGVLFIGEIFIHAKAKTWKEFGKATGVFILSLLLVLGTKLTWFQMNRSYLKETMRGGHSELVSDNAEDAEPEKLVGLDFDYATAWSYGKTETFTLLVPEYMGGCSGYDLGKNSKLEKELKSMGVPANSARAYCSASPVYWGEKQFTSGPVYVGAVVCFLFILGLIVVKGVYKWTLLAATCFSILLAWGHNFEWFSRLFFDYFPMYNKFRTVESILVVAEITMPLLGFLAIKHLVQSDDKAADRKAILTAGTITAAICLLVAISAGFTDTTSSYDAGLRQKVGEKIYEVILRQRQALISSSALRSLVFVLLGAAATYAYTVMKEKKNSTIMFAAALSVLILIDMVPVDRKFFGKQNFITQKESAQTFAMQDWEKAILQDKAPGYRVLNLSSMYTFSEARTSYRLNSLGGYSAAKMRRYQDLIDAHISKNNMSVLNMLNTKYIITDSRQILRNPEAMGNAWFVDTLIFVNSPVNESKALNTIDIKTTAVADSKFADILNISVSANDPDAYITLDKYVPDRMEYTSSSTKDKVAVFSEIYYPNEWHLYIDGQEHEIGRVNYVLRAAVIPAGKHSIVMEFVPDALKNDWICMILVILTIIISIGMPVWHFVKKK